MALMSIRQGLNPKKIAAAAVVTATDRLARDRGVSLAELARTAGYAPKALDNARRDGGSARLVMALRAVAADAEPLPEE